MRIVLDVNVYISAVITGRGNPAEIIERWKRGEFDVVISSPILEELERVIHYPRIQERYVLPEHQVRQFLRLIRSQAVAVDPSIEITAVEEDSTDNRYLECAVTGEASYIVSGDSHLLRLKEYHGVVVLNPTGFLAVLKVEEGWKDDTE